MWIRQSERELYNLYNIEKYSSNMLTDYRKIEKQIAKIAVKQKMIRFKVN